MAVAPSPVWWARADGAHEERSTGCDTESICGRRVPNRSQRAFRAGVFGAGFGSAGFGSAGFGSAGFGSAGFGSAGFGSAGFGSRWAHLEYVVSAVGEDEAVGVVDEELGHAVGSERGGDRGEEGLRDGRHARERDTGDGDGTPPPPKVDRGIVDAATPAAAPRGSGEWNNNDGREQSGKLGA